MQFSLSQELAKLAQLLPIRLERLTLSYSISKKDRTALIVKVHITRFKRLFIGVMNPTQPFHRYTYSYMQFNLRINHPS
ncbi:hypothetical protein D3C86_1911750 [compost metagenome]